ncbi:SEC-C motif domain protein [Desulfobulbus propionicus DSM 2032]|uniref:SEC-C motif domain protein n=1 Tax=Desulfobulbus propionicus (strain ATCC 33891 / DSM 2032 / VKM B-1956 / 1pr3) TaxID=577650 RepID=A0A7U3YPY4_DESPD|nr:YchJ family metal-binding protein [Desulfobulbus propionicus]ADW19405.1 SEC-C motif domain protein [Desulfobulbus propionicus DSM 2032]
MHPFTSCPCGSGVVYADCCEPLLSGRSRANTALALMRSRYTAYVRAAVGYLLATWHPSTRPSTIDSTTIPAWCDLVILRTDRGGEKDGEGVVEFRATARTGDGLIHLHEISRFVCEEGQWFYVAGQLVEDGPDRRADKVGRNSPCPCGSGKKFKRCCGP